MDTPLQKSSPIDAHFHPSGPIPKDYWGCGIGLAPHEERDGLYGTYGIHPWSIQNNTVFTPPKIPQIIGEVGIDKQKRYRSTLTKQLDYLHEALHFAQTHQLPVVVHCVRAFAELHQAFKKYPTLNVYIHGYVGSFEQASGLIQSQPNLYFGFSPHAQHSPKTIRCFERLSLHHILVETDTAPDIDLLCRLYQHLAQIKRTPLEVLLGQMKLNFMAWVKP